MLLMIVIICISGIITIIAVGGLIWLILSGSRKRKAEANPNEDCRREIADLAQQMAILANSTGAMGEVLTSAIASLPGDILRSIQGSINQRKGKAGELIALLNLSRGYDRIIPLGQPIDIIGIGSDSIDFIEVKTGSSVLTASEKHIKDLVDSGRVRFILARLDMDVSSVCNDLGDRFDHEEEG